MPVAAKFVIIVGLIFAATAAGYLARRLKLVPERAAERIMTLLVVFGYSSVAFLSIWSMELRLSHAWLPTLTALHCVIMAACGLGLARMLGRGRSEIGLFGLASAVGNNGFTLGAFIVYLLYGERGLGLASMLGLAWTPVIVLLMYPIARSYSDTHPRESLGRLMARSIFDWRSVGMPIALGAVAMSLAGVPRPEAVRTYHLVDVLMFAMAALAYFAIGLRLHAWRIWSLKGTILALAGMRFGLAALVGLALASLTWWTAWPLKGIGWEVFVIESFVPTAVTMAAVANMFALRPRDASALFVANTAMYLVFVLPVVLFLFGR